VILNLLHGTKDSIIDQGIIHPSLDRATSVDQA